MKKKRIAVVGSLNYDIILKQKRLPKIGETYTADSISFCNGGKGANQAVQCSKLGADTVMIGCVGYDNFGNEVIRGLKKYDVNTDYIKKTENSTGIGVVNALENGELIATISKGANYDINIEDIDKAAKIIKNSEIIILQLEIPMEIIEYTIDLANENGVFIILNAAPAIPIKKSIFSKIDCLVVNETEANFYLGREAESIQFSEEDCKELFSKIKKLLIITLGEKGSLIYDGKNLEHIKSYKVDAIETTGAGDSFIGAFAYKLLNGSSYLEAAIFSSVVSALTVTKVGAQDSMPTLHEVKKIFQNNNIVLKC